MGYALFCRRSDTSVYKKSIRKFSYALLRHYPLHGAIIPDQVFWYNVFTALECQTVQQRNGSGSGLVATDVWYHAGHSRTVKRGLHDSHHLSPLWLGQFT